MKIISLRSAHASSAIVLMTAAAILSLEPAASQGNMAGLRNFFSRNQQQQQVAPNQQAINPAGGMSAQMPSANAAASSSMPVATAQAINNQIKYYESAREFEANTRAVLSQRFNEELRQPEMRAIVQYQPGARKQLAELIFKEHRQFETSLGQFGRIIEQTRRAIQQPARSFQLFSSPGSQLAAAWKRCMAARHQLSQRLQFLDNFIRNQLPYQAVGWFKYTDGDASSYAPHWITAPAQQALQQLQQQRRVARNGYAPQFSAIPE